VHGEYFLNWGITFFPFAIEAKEFREIQKLSTV